MENVPACTAHAQRDTLLQYANGRQKPVAGFTGVLTNGQRGMRQEFQRVAFIPFDETQVGDGRTVDTHEAAARRLPQELFHHFQLPPDGEARAVRHVEDAVVVRCLHPYDVRIAKYHITRLVHRSECKDSSFGFRNGYEIIA